jgi:hypothetical protein
MEWFKRFGDVEDVSHLHKPGDFYVTIDGIRYLIDVKNDKHIDTTRRFLLEETHIYPSGWRKPGWSYDPHVHFIAVLGRRSRRVWLFNLKEFQRIRDTLVPEADAYQDNVEYVSYCLLYPIVVCRRAGLVWRDIAHVPTLS